MFAQITPLSTAYKSNLFAILNSPTGDLYRFILVIVCQTSSVVGRAKKRKISDVTFEFGGGRFFWAVLLLRDFNQIHSLNTA